MELELLKQILDKLTDLEQEVKANRAETKENTEAIKVLQTETKELRAEAKAHRIQTKENTDILKALKYAGEMLDAKVTALDFDSSKIIGEIAGINDNFEKIKQAVS